MQNTEMTVAELYQLRELLQKWEQYYKGHTEFWKERITKENAIFKIDDAIHFIATAECEARKVRHVIREVEFQIEDMTDEVLVK